MIKEVIVVEGRDDLDAVKKAVDAEVIITQGFSLSKSVLNRIRLAQQKKGVIIFTDPDHAGEQIRRRIKDAVPGCKDAYLVQNKATKSGDIGIENASPEAIREALTKAKVAYQKEEKKFIKDDLVALGLIGGYESKELRDKVGNELGIGYANGKQFLNRLNNYGITREEFILALEKVTRGVEDGNC
ncbi:ribonuclease M5 [Orenia metallireducens]|uniref:Ribonuclease M5 n=1 Tax=Orenia metallireducens TaxID=1413210 RepID=A0A1C0A6N6_9FIRM|nr:ribonuclease M5 [Orenia metallireducens]OCL25779.1 ribonuclease M5 [Orenia metallireducens]